MGFTKFHDFHGLSRFLQKSLRSGRDAKTPSIPNGIYMYFGSIFTEAHFCARNRKIY